MRDISLDFVKAIAICFIIIGHLNFLPEPIKNFIYYWHVPIFFIVTGVLYKGRVRSKKILNILKKYYYFAILASLLWIPKAYILEELSFNFIFGIIVGVGDNTYLPQSQPLWFFYAFCVSYLIAGTLIRAFNVKIALAIAFLLLLIVIILNKYTGSYIRYFGFGTGCVGSFFIVLGFSIKKLLHEQLIYKQKNILFLFYTVILLIFLNFIDLRYSIDVNSLRFDNLYVTLPITIFLSLFFTFYLSLASSIISKKFYEPIKYISSNTLWYFPLHTAVFPYITLLLLTVLDMHSLELMRLDFWYLFILMYLVFSILIIELLKRFLSKGGL